MGNDTPKGGISTTPRNGQDVPDSEGFIDPAAAVDVVELINGMGIGDRVNRGDLTIDRVPGGWIYHCQRIVTTYVPGPDGKVATDENGEPRRVPLSAMLSSTYVPDVGPLEDGTNQILEELEWFKVAKRENEQLRDKIQALEEARDGFDRF